MKKLLTAALIAASFCVLTTAQAGSFKNVKPSPITIMSDDDTCHGC